jgi:metallo-beta-lactamase family protein yycJ
MQYISVSSGSSGNCHFISDGNTKILIDAGLSGKKIEKNLWEHSEDLKEIQGIFVTHEHLDHIKGVGILSRRYNIPVYATEGTWRGMEQGLGNIIEKNQKIIEIGSSIEIGTIQLNAYSVLHDALEPCGFTITDGRKKVSIATDLGCVTKEVVGALQGSDLVVLESNYDDELLRYSGYPYALKSRLRSNQGHLSNEDAGKLSVFLVQSGINRIALAHLSKENNHPMLAHQVVSDMMKEQLITEKDVELSVLLRDCVSEQYIL